MLQSLNVVAVVVPELRHVQNREFTMPLIVYWRLKPRFFLNCLAQDTSQRKIILLLAIGSFQPFELEIGRHIAFDSTTSGAEGFSAPPL